MNRNSNFSMRVVCGGIFIEDLGPWDKYPSVTNNIKNVIKIVDQKLQLLYHRRVEDYPVIYLDSLGEFSGIVINKNNFDEFVYIGKFDSVEDAMNYYKEKIFVPQ